MSIYTVHEPPLRATEVSADPERFAFVRDGFCWPAFLFAPLWMLWHRLWLVLAIYVVSWVAIEAAVWALGASVAISSVIAILIAVLVGLEASTLRRFTLSRRSWRNVGVISGDDLEEAERRFFDAWLRQPPSRPAAPSMPASAPPTVPPPPAVARMPQAPGVTGLFPEPGAHR